MSRQPSSDDVPPWWPGKPGEFRAMPPVDPNTTTLPLSPPGRMPPNSASGLAGPTDAQEYDSDAGPPRQALVRSRRAERRQTTARMLAPILMLALITGFIVVLRLPDSSSAQPVITQSSTVSASLQAYITGAIVHPGVYRLHSGDRVYNLLDAAGGPTDDADLACVNLAALVVDGEEVYIPHRSERPANGPISCTVAKVNMNTASANDMHLLLGISQATAEKIVAYRNAHGPFTSLEQLIPVVGLTIYNRIKDMITL